jgi:hypothetical protein
MASGGAWRRPLALVLLGLTGGVVAMVGAPASPGGWFAMVAVTGLGVVVLEALVIRHDPRVLPVMLAGLAVPGALLGIARQGFPEAALAGALELVAIAFMTWWWVRQLEAVGDRDAPATSTASGSLAAAPPGPA